MKSREINCPNCNEVFALDQTGYARIVHQIRDRQFEDELNLRLKERLELETIKMKNASVQEISLKDSNIVQLQHQLEMSRLEGQKKLIEQIEKINNEHREEIQRVELGNKLLEKELEQIRDFKLKQTVKLVGESLEQHCETEFTRMRPLAFQNAVFGKDNNSLDGTKGDYIFREHDTSGNELLSIMFDMKHEQESSKNKSKNNDHLKKLDADRNAKNCEYAVLVSTLERENELYNTGIVDMSHQYKKMYIVRPQFFLPIIGLLRNGAQAAFEYKAELARVKNQEEDLLAFQKGIDEFKRIFGTQVTRAHSNYLDAIKSIDDSIKQLNKAKTFLETSSKQLTWANDNINDKLSIKKLTAGNPTMQKKFDDLNSELT